MFATWFSIFWKLNDFFLKNEINFFLFSFFFPTFAQNFKPTTKKDSSWCVFECFKSHCHILKTLHEYLCSALVTFFGEGNFIFNFLGYGFVRKSFGAECTFEEVVKKQNVKNSNVNPFTMKLGWFISPNFSGPKFLGF